jgi:hypothetical protein
LSVPFRAVVLFGGLAAFANPLHAQATPIEEFVHRSYEHGLPYEEASRYQSAVLPVLLQMLQDPAEAPYWRNIVTVLGIVGDDSVVAPLTAFARAGEGLLSADEYHARSAVLIALGYVANKESGQAALDYLLASVDPAVWETRGFRWQSPFHTTQAARDQRLSETALLGLALSGRAKAAAALRTMVLGAGPTGARGPRTLSVASEALMHLEVVSQYGLSGYYARSGLRARSPER